MFRETMIREIGYTYETTPKKCYQVCCGCQTFIFTDPVLLQQFMHDYINDPERIEKEWNRKQGSGELREAYPPGDSRRAGSISVM
jgi:hypothetical protein